jgi:hypothetical protein
VADFFANEEALPARDSAFTSHGNDVVVFRGVTWVEPRPDLGPSHSIQFSGIPGIEVPDSAVARCDFTDAFAVASDQGAIVVRIALRPGWLEIVDNPEEVTKFFALRGYT